MTGVVHAGCPEARGEAGNGGIEMTCFYVGEARVRVVKGLVQRVEVKSISVPSAHSLYVSRSCSFSWVFSSFTLSLPPCGEHVLQVCLARGGALGGRGGVVGKGGGDVHLDSVLSLELGDALFLLDIGDAPLLEVLDLQVVCVSFAGVLLGSEGRYGVTGS